MNHKHTPFIDPAATASYTANAPLKVPGLRIPNGWNDPDERFRKGADKFWEATRALEKL